MTLSGIQKAKIMNRINSAMNNAGTKEDFIEYGKKEMDFVKLSIKGRNDGSDFPEWPATVKFKTWEEFEEAMNYLGKAGFDKDWVSEILEEEKQHVGMLDGHEKVQFILRFYTEADGVNVEPAVRLTDDRIEDTVEGWRNFRKKVVRVAGIGESTSRWDDELINNL